MSKVELSYYKILFMYQSGYQLKQYFKFINLFDFLHGTLTRHDFLHGPLTRHGINKVIIKFHLLITV